jgi:CheY-specific phosphatase CheX
MPSKIDPLSEVACAVTREVLDTMFFATAEPVPCRHPESGADWIAAKVRFDGSPRGDLRVMLSRELAAIIASGFLGIELEEATDEKENQIACELANIICGAVLSRLHPDARVALDAPEVIPVEFVHTAGTHQCFETPEGMLAVTMVTSA